MGWCGKLWAVLLEYDTVKFVTVKNKKVGLLHRLIQLTILGYIIGYVLILKKGYQEFSDIQSVAITKVKGVVYTNNSDEEFDTNVESENRNLYRRIWDITDLVIPPSENDAFFIATNIVITPNQSLSTCPESPDVAEAHCDPGNNTCLEGHAFLLGDGVATGLCHNDSENSTCEVYAWCPVEKDFGPLKAMPLLDATGEFTVLIKNFIDFPLYKVARRNILNTQDKSYLTSCTHDDDNPLCPIFVLREIVERAGHNYTEVAFKGGVFAIRINWECNLDLDISKCIPSYSFLRLDNPEAVLAKGWNFRYANYFNDNHRTLYKLYGLDFVVIVTGRGGRFNIIPLLLNIGSGLGLLALATVVADFSILYILKKKDVYKSNKYYEVQTEYDEFTNIATDIRRRSRRSPSTGSEIPVLEGD